MLSGDEIRIAGGCVSSQGTDGELYEANEKAFVLNARTLEWRADRGT